jgi:hypothetical protein
LWILRVKAFYLLWILRVKAKGYKHTGGRGIAAGEGEILIALAITLHMMSYVNCYIMIGILQ